MARSQNSGSMSPAEQRAFAREQDRWLKKQEQEQHRTRVAEINEELADTRRQAREQHAACAAETRDVRAAASRDAAAGRKQIAETRHEAETRARDVWRAARARLQADKDARIAAQEGSCALQDAAAREEAERLTAARKQERRDARALRLTERHQAEREREQPKRRESTEEKIDALAFEVEHSAPELMPYLRAQPRRALAALVNDVRSRASAFERFVEQAGEDEEGVTAALADAYGDDELAAQQAEYMRAAGVPF